MYSQKTALHIAAGKNNMEIVQLLLQNDNINIKAKDGITNFLFNEIKKKKLMIYFLLLMKNAY